MLMSRRILLGLLMVMVGLLVIVVETAVIADHLPHPIPLPHPPPRYVSHAPATAMPIALERINPDEIIYQDAETILFATAGDSCSTAALLEFPQGGTGTGANTPVGQLNQAPGDPVLSCMWGNPPDPRGYRTAWYRFSVPRNGQVTINTFGSNYDTVLAVYEGSCAQLQMLACNDDHNMFSSKATLSVRTGQTYYIEVADWEPSNPGGKNLELSVVLDPIESEWVQFENGLAVPRTRHIGLTAGDFLYVLGGFSSFAGPDNYQASTRVDRLHVPTGQWSRMVDIPAGGANRIGYFNSSGAHVNGRIYIPSGDDGSSDFAGQHWALDIAQNRWLGPSDNLASINWAAWTEDGLPVGFAATATRSDGYYLTGGMTNANSRFNSVGYTFFYNVNDNSWSQQVNMNTSRYAHVSAWIGNRLCVAGGIHINESNVPVLEPSAECYDAVAGSWAPIANMNIARYGAGSAVGPNGKWYVFGGIKEDNNPAPEVEVYDPATGQWRVLGAKADLGGTGSSPARSWPRGGFVGNHLWVAGGNLVANNVESGVLSLVERFYVPPLHFYLPFLQGPPVDPATINNTFTLAQHLPLNQPLFQNFAIPLDYYDTFFFDLPAQRVITIDLTNIPGDHDYDLLLYNNNKTLLASSRNLAGQDEQIALNLPSGRYYVVVERVLPAGLPDPNVYYRLLLR